MRFTRLILVVASIALLSSCITVRGNPEHERTRASGYESVKKPSASPSRSAPLPWDIVDTDAPAAPSTPPRTSPSATKQLPAEESSAPPRTSAPEPSQTRLQPCSVLDQNDVRRVTTAFGAAETTASTARVDQWMLFSCTYGTVQERQLKFTMALDTTDSYELWRLMVDAAKRAGNFSPFQGIGDKAFRGGEYDIAVRKGGLILFFSNSERQLKPDTSKRLVASVFQGMGW